MSSMDFYKNPGTVVQFTVWLLLLFLNTLRAQDYAIHFDDEEDSNEAI